MPGFDNRSSKRSMARFGSRSPWAGAFCLCVALLSLLGPVAGSAGAAQTGQVAVAIEPAQVTQAAGNRFSVNVAVSGVSDLGAFELTLRYDATLVQIDSVNSGQFIGSTGRTAILLGPNNDRATGQLNVGALTTGAQAGAGGGGILVTLNCTALRAGQGELTLATVRLSSTAGSLIPAASTGGRVSFTGNEVVPTATAAPVTPTATAVSPTATPTPTPRPALPTATTQPASPTPGLTATARPVSPTLSAVASPGLSATPAQGTPPAPGTPVASPAGTAVIATPTPALAATPGAAQEALRTRAIQAATETAQAQQTAEARATPTPSATGVAPTGQPSAAATRVAVVGTVAPAAPRPAGTPAGSPGAAIGLIAAGVATGAAALFLWLRWRSRARRA